MTPRRVVCISLVVSLIPSVLVTRRVCVLLRIMSVNCGRRMRVLRVPCPIRMRVLWRGVPTLPTLFRLCRLRRS